MNLNLTKENSRRLKLIIFTSFAISLVSQVFEPYQAKSFTTSQNPRHPILEEKYQSSNNRIDNSLDLFSETHPKIGDRSTQASKEEIKTVTIVDYAEPTPTSRLPAPFSTLATHPCGDRSTQYT